MANEAHTTLALDHFITPVRNFDNIDATWEKLGFIVMEPMKHEELGSWNRVIQFNDTYLEILSGIETAIEPLRLLFEPLLANSAGLCFVGFNTQGVEDHRERLARQGFALSPRNDARRKVLLPDGSYVETASASASVLYADHPLMSLFLSEHARPEAIWQDAYQQHPNGVRRVSGVSWLADSDPKLRHYFDTMLYGSPTSMLEGCLEYTTRRGERLMLLNGRNAVSRYGGHTWAPNPSFVKRALALEFQVVDIAATKSYLVKSGAVWTEAQDGAAIVPEQSTGGILLRFHE